MNIAAPVYGFAGTVGGAAGEIGAGGALVVKTGGSLSGGCSRNPISLLFSSGSGISIRKNGAGF